MFYLITLQPVPSYPHYCYLVLVRSSCDDKMECNRKNKWWKWQTAIERTFSNYCSNLVFRNCTFSCCLPFLTFLFCNNSRFGSNILNCNYTFYLLVCHVPNVLFVRSFFLWNSNMTILQFKPPSIDFLNRKIHTYVTKAKLLFRCSFSVLATRKVSSIFKLPDTWWYFHCNEQWLISVRSASFWPFFH